MNELSDLCAVMCKSLMWYRIHIISRCQLCFTGTC